jgi:hypothetical protein
MKKSCRIGLFVTLLVLSALSVRAQSLPAVASFSFPYMDGTEYVYDQWALTEEQLAVVKFSATLDGGYKVLAGAGVTIADKTGATKTYETTQIPAVTNPYTDPTSWQYKYWYNVAKVVAFTKQYVIFQIRNTIPSGTDEWILASYQIKGSELRPKGTVIIQKKATAGIETSLDRVDVTPSGAGVVNILTLDTHTGTGLVTSKISKYDISLTKSKGSASTGSARLYDGKYVNDLLPHPFKANYWYEMVDSTSGSVLTRKITVYKY